MRPGITLLSFFAALLLGRVPLQGSAPLGAAVIFASSLSGIHPFFAMLGAVLGAFLQPEPLWSPIIAGAAYVVTLTLYSLFDRPISSTVKVVLFLLSQLAALPFAPWDGAASLGWLLLSVAISLLCGLLLLRDYTILRGIAKRRSLTDIEQAVLCAGISLVLLSLSEFSYFGASLPVIVMALFSMVAVYARGMSGVFAAALLPAVMILYGTVSASLAGSLAICALLAALAARWGKAGILGAYLLGALFSRAYWDSGAHGLNAQNIILAGILFGVMPRDWLAFAKNRMHALRMQEKSTSEALKRMQRQTAEELSRMEKLCGDIANLFKGTAGQPGQAELIRRWTVHGAMRVCAECEARTLCWEDAGRMREAVMQLVFQFDKGERVAPLAPMGGTCTYFSEMLTAAHLSYHQALAEKAHQERLAGQNAFVKRQLLGVGEVLAGIAGRLQGDGWLDGEAEAELLLALEKQGIPVLAVDARRLGGNLLMRIVIPAKADAPLGKIMGAAGKALHGSMRLLRTEQRGKAVVYELEESRGLRASAAVVSVPERADGVSGDATGEYRLPQCRVLYALSDGMGSGPLAREESNAAIELLFNLYRIGFSRDLVYENVNRLLHARAQAEMYATLDAVTLDLSTGDAELMKYGAPPTYLVREGRVKLLAGEALPCGIVDEAKPSLHRFRLKKEDILVLCSDGIYDLLGGQTERTIAEGQGLSEQQLAQSIVEEARRRGQKDDMTVMVIGVA